ncbi:MAG: MltA domain-containing protein [Elusimicrobiota bacterium]
MKNIYKTVFFIFVLSACHHQIKKTEVYQTEVSCPVCQPPQPMAPVCAKDEVLVCKKIEVKEVSIVKLNENDYPDFSYQWGGDMERVFDLNEKYLNGVLSKNVSYSFENRKITPEILLKTTVKLREILKNSKSDPELNKLIKENFDIYELKRGTEIVTFSSYYEPVFDGSLKKDEVFKFPLYRKPDDMYEINLEEFDSDKYKGQKLTGRIDGKKFIPYYSRSQIDFDGIISGKGYEIAYMKDITDLLDLHTQGSGILKLKEGGYKRVKFAATNSLKFKGWMTALIEGGYIKRDGAVGKDNTFYDRAKKFINENPNLWREVIGSNKRYAFFSLDDLKSFDEGPIGTYGFNLVGGRSIAIDNSLIPMGTPAFIKVNLPDVDDKLNIKGFNENKRFVFAHDTGGAIKGARVDYFAGTGDRAKKFAYSVWEKGNLYLIVIKEGK